MDTRVNTFIANNLCPPCLADPPGAIGLGNDNVTDNNAHLGEIYICPGP